ncbi:hypothetical protein JYU34_016200 [Plutella xylostella]|uniref:Uncharacterized protein n=1 Tax=Plutella xylostella TaxID=51655 RepID=A0ABQ7Q5S9_PLUXY|nr:hypothetical protein JYU34_016200 [Plutella xylostella]
MSPINNLINITVPHLHIANESQQELEKEASVIENKINDLKNKQVLISDSVSNHDIHHYAMIYLLVGAAGMVGLIYMARRVQCGRQRTPTTRADGEGAQTRSPATAAAAEPRQSRTTVARQESAHTVFEMLERRRENKSTSPVLKKFNDFISENSV